MDWGHLLFSFNGRINRAKFWLAILIYVVVVIILAIIGAVVGSGTLAVIVGFVVYVAMFISGLAIAAKRLHDRNKSALWLLVFYLLPMVLSGIGVAITIYGAAGGSGSMTSIGSIFSLIGTAISIWAFVELGCLRGTVGPNQYGPDPLEGTM